MTALVLSRLTRVHTRFSVISRRSSSKLRHLTGDYWLVMVCLSLCHCLQWLKWKKEVPRRPNPTFPPCPSPSPPLFHCWIQSPQLGGQSCLPIPHPPLSFPLSPFSFSLSDVRPRQLRSSDSVSCAVRRTWTTYGDRCFAVAGPRVWNSLPTKLRQSDSLGQFKRR